MRPPPCQERCRGDPRSVGTALAMPPCQGLYPTRHDALSWRSVKASQHKNREISDILVVFPNTLGFFYFSLVSEKMCFLEKHPEACRHHCRGLRRLGAYAGSGIPKVLDEQDRQQYRHVPCAEGHQPRLVRQAETCSVLPRYKGSHHCDVAVRL